MSAEVPQQHFLSASSQVSQGVCMTEPISLITVLGVNRTGGVQGHGSGPEISVSVAKIPLAATSVCRCQTFDCLPTIVAARDTVLVVQGGLHLLVKFFSPCHLLA